MNSSQCSTGWSGLLQNVHVSSASQVVQSPRYSICLAGASIRHVMPLKKIAGILALNLRIPFRTAINLIALIKSLETVVDFKTGSPVYGPLLVSAHFIVIAVEREKFRCSQQTAETCMTGHHPVKLPGQPSPLPLRNRRG